MLIPRIAHSLAVLCLLSGTASWSQIFTPRPTAANLGRLPLTFVKQGSQFSARGEGYLIGLDAGTATIRTLPARDSEKAQFLSIGFLHGRPATAVAGPKLSGVVNYITGNDPHKWQIGLPTVDRVTYPEVYPGIDVVYYGNQQQLEFDLVVKPGADPRAIRMKIQGGGNLSIDPDGALKMGNVNGLRIGLPKIYQDVNGVRKNIAGRFSIAGNDEVAFGLNMWDRTQPLIIDPTIVYSTLLGGSGTTSAIGIAVDASRNVLVAGSTSSFDFPAVNSTRSSLAGNSDGFISKVNADGTALIYSTFFGGSSTDSSAALAVDSQGAGWITGATGSVDFPLVNAAQSHATGYFVMKVDENGVPVFSTFLGSVISGYSSAIAVDASGNGYVTGSASSGFPTTPGVVLSSTTGITLHAFVSKYSPSGQVLYSTYLGGSGQDDAFGIAADSNGDAYVTGFSSSPTFIGAPDGGAQTTNKGNGDAFVAKLKSDGSALLYFTFLGGSAEDVGNAIAVDASLNAYVSGTTGSAGLATPGAAQTTPGGATDGFIAKLNPSGNAFSYFTYLGGSRQDYPKAIASDAAGNIYVTGSTESPDFPMASPVQGTIAANTTSLFSSTDAGESWTPADTGIPGAVFDLSMNPAGTSAVVMTESGIYRTTSGGSTWTRQLSLSQSAQMTMSRSLATPSTIYATSCCDPLITFDGYTVYRSTDDGVTWSTRAAVTSFGTEEIVADPLSADTVYLRGSSGLMRSTDGGSSWLSLSNSVAGSILAMIGAPDGALYAAVQNGAPIDVYKSINHGLGWWRLNVGLAAEVLYSPHQLTASGSVVNAAFNSIYQSTNGGRTWRSRTGPEAMYELEISPKDPSFQYAVGASGYVLKSIDGGATWNSTSMLLNPPGLSTAAFSRSRLIADPSDASHVFAIAAVNSAVFATKLNNTGSAFAWSTFLGGSGSASGNAIATDGAGNAYLTGNTGSFAGNTSSSIFPVTITPLSGMSVFITKISEGTGDCAPVLNGTDQTITGKSQAVKFSVVAPSGCNWTASTDAEWATITSGSSATGAGVITVQVAANTGVSARTATLKVANSAVKIAQAGNFCSYSLDTPPSPYLYDQPAYTVPSGGGMVTAVLTATDGCPWTLINPYPTTVQVKSGASGTGNGTIQLTIPAASLTNTDRIFNLFVGLTTLRILQLYRSPQSQSISFPAIPDQTVDFAPPPLAATSNSLFPVTFTSNTPAVCQVSGTAVTLIGVGVCSITANQAGNALYFAAAPVTQTFAVTAGPAVPQPTGGIANAASAGQATPSVVGLGSYVAIYGFALAGKDTPTAATLPLPTSLNGTQATLGGVPMPLLYSVSGQINALVPMGLTPSQSLPLVVTRGGIPSAPVSLNVVQLQPGIYTVDTSGRGAGIVTNSLTGQLITRDNPATVGDYLTIYCTGLGPVHGPNGEAGPADGAAAPLDLLYYTNATVTASLAVAKPQVLFSGLTPSFAGLYQVNIQVPPLGDFQGTESATLQIAATDAQSGTTQSNAVIVYVYVH